MKSAIASGVFFLPFLIGLTHAKLVVSHMTEVRQEHDTLSVMCRDIDAVPAKWKGPKNRALGEKTIPQAKTTMHGAQLIFQDIKKGDAGIYVCKTPTDVAQFELAVEDKKSTKIENERSFYNHYGTPPFQPTVPPYSRYTTLVPSTTPAPITFVDTPSNVTAKEGTDVILRCEAKDANTEWLLNGEPPVKGGKFEAIADGLVIKNVSIEDADNEYTCKAINTASGHMEFKPITLNIIHPPRAKYAKLNIVYGYLGGEVNLTCAVDAVPPPTFRWFHTGHRKIIGKEVQGESPNTSILMVILQEHKDLGNYKCEVRNSEGDLDILFQILNGTQPSPPIDMQITSANSSAIFLTLEEPEATDQEIKDQMQPIGFQVEYRPIDDTGPWGAQYLPLTSDKSYAITQLSQNTTYQVRAATKNNAGISIYTNTTEYTTSSAYSVCADIYLYIASLISTNFIITRLI